MSAVPKKLKKSREELREAIVTSASRMFAMRGFSAPTLREITSDAGVSLPIVYWFFTDKRELYKHCCKQVLEQDHDILELAVNRLRDPAEIVYCALVATCEIMIRTGGTAIIHRLMLENDTEILTIMSEMLDERGLYRKFDRALAKIPSEKPVRWLTLTAMCAGLAEFSYFFETMPGMSKMASSSTKLADYLLELTFPAVAWADVGKRLAPRVAEIKRAI